MTQSCLETRPAGIVCYDNGTDDPYNLFAQVLYEFGKPIGVSYYLDDPESPVDTSGGTITVGGCDNQVDYSTLLGEIITQVTAINANTDGIEATLTAIQSDTTAITTNTANTVTELQNVITELQGLAVDTTAIEALITTLIATVTAESNDQEAILADLLECCQTESWCAPKYDITDKFYLRVSVSFENDVLVYSEDGALVNSVPAPASSLFTNSSYDHARQQIITRIYPSGEWLGINPFTNAITNYGVFDMPVGYVSSGGFGYNLVDGLTYASATIGATTSLYSVSIESKKVELHAALSTTLSGVAITNDGDVIGVKHDTPSAGQTEVYDLGSIGNITPQVLLGTLPFNTTSAGWDRELNRLIVVDYANNNRNYTLDPYNFSTLVSGFEAAASGGTISTGMISPVCLQFQRCYEKTNGVMTVTGDYDLDGNDYTVVGTVSNSCTLSDCCDSTETTVIELSPIVDLTRVTTAHTAPYTITAPFKSVAIHAVSADVVIDGITAPAGFDFNLDSNEYEQYVDDVVISAGTDYFTVVVS